MSVALLHAYRSANRGDGWLVELSRQLVGQATGREPVVYALDPTGMGQPSRAVFPSPMRIRAGITALAASAGPASRLTSATMTLPERDELTLAVGIGGGYLRSSDPVHELVFRAHHLPQLQLLASLGPRALYLPVSVGPFRRGLGRTVRQLLGRTAVVAVRDDRSNRYLRGWARTERLPDLAACHIGVERPELRANRNGIVGIALRSLDRSDLGFETVSVLKQRGLTPCFGIQSSEGRTNDDRSLYASRGVLTEASDFGSLLEAEPRPAVVLAGRLHAALAAIAAGIPTVHLGYERKSAGAYADLGLSDYVVDAWTGDPGTLADLIEGVADDPGPYWARLSGRFDPLSRSWDRLVELVGETASGVS